MDRPAGRRVRIDRKRSPPYDSHGRHRADGTLRSSLGSQGSAVQEQEETSKCRRR